MSEFPTLSHQEVQDRLYDLLVAFADFCDENELRYFIYSGTLLGAVRHQDFIPWDDDVDVCMPRPDYERFVRLARTNPWPNYAVRQYAQPFVKFVDLRIGFAERLLRDEYREESLFLDVFPVDGVPSDHLDRHFRKLKLNRWKLFASVGDPKRIDRKTKGVKRLWVILLLESRIFRNPSRYIGRMDREARRYPYIDCEDVSQCVWDSEREGISNRQAFEEYVELPFRTRLFRCQGDYEESLRRMYGDYMVLPPVESRPPSHGIYWYRDASEGD